MFANGLVFVCLLVCLQSANIAKTALKLLLVFVEYSEFNTMLLLQAVSFIDVNAGQW
jgi:serine/threonine-protein kinase RIO1